MIHKTATPSRCPTKAFPAAVAVSVNGGRQNNIAFNIDGVSAEDIFSN